MTAIWIGIGLVVATGALLITLYNGLVRSRNETENAWSQIDVQLKRRHDLIPNLVETAKGFMQHEAETLEKVTQARSAALMARGTQQVGVAEAALGQAVQGLFGLAESYPDLNANENFLVLQEELTTTENRIGFARQAYNDAATSYNTRRETFPSNLIAGAFKAADLFEIQNPSHRLVPQVQF